MRQTIRIAIALPLLLAAAGAQMRDNQQKDLDCKGQSSGRPQRFCEVRESTAAAAGRLSVDAGRNGGITIKGWARNELLVRTRVESWASTEGEAQSLASQVRVSVNAGRVVVEGPSSANEQSWSTSFEIFVPQRSDLELAAHNGGVNMSDVSGDIQFRTVNGGVHITRLGGRVRGSTTNGGVHVALDGARWDGAELDVKTTNGGVHLDMPQSYSAQVEASTVNGRVHSGMPGAKADRDTRRFASAVGSGGALVRAVTTNGSVHIGRN